MRKETDDFVCQMDSVDSISAESSKDRVYINSYNPVSLTKQQAREFAKQILEMTGDEDESVQ